MQLSEDTLHEIVGMLETGLRCFVHIQNGKLVSFPSEYDSLSMDSDIWQDEIDKIEKEPDDYLEIEGMDSSDSYRVMQSFAETVPDTAVRARLEQALSGVRPFANFKIQVDSSGPYREKWFRFKSNKMLEWVKKQIESYPMG